MSMKWCRLAFEERGDLGADNNFNSVNRLRCISALKAHPVVERQLAMTRQCVWPIVDGSQCVA